MAPYKPQKTNYNEKKKKMCKLNLQNIMLKDYTKLHKRNIKTSSSYVEVPDGKRTIDVRKTSLCWLLEIDYHKISSDRLERVKGPHCKSTKCFKKNIQRTKLALKTKPAQKY